MQRVGSDVALQVEAQSTPDNFDVRVKPRQLAAKGIILIELGRPDNGVLPSWATDAQGLPFHLRHHARQGSSCAFFDQLSGATYSDKLHLSVEEVAPTPISLHTQLFVRPHSLHVLDI